MICQVSKLVSLSDDVYAALFRMKGAGESFSQVVRRLLAPKPRKRDVSEFFGMWKDDPRVEKVFAEVARHRETAKMRDVAF